MDAGYVIQKEVSEGGLAGMTVFSNAVLVVTIFKSDGCNDDANCATLVFLFLSIFVYIVLTVMVAILARREKKNETKRNKNEEIQLENKQIEFQNEKISLQNENIKLQNKNIRKQNKKIRRQNKQNMRQQDKIPEIQEIVPSGIIKDLKIEEDKLKGKESFNDRMNTAILVLTIIGFFLNTAINALNLSVSLQKNNNNNSNNG